MRLNASRTDASRKYTTSMRLPAASAANSGFSGDKPAAIKSAFTKGTMLASRSGNSRAKVVLPPPFGPAMITQRGWFLFLIVDCYQLFQPPHPTQGSRCILRKFLVPVEEFSGGVSGLALRQYDSGAMVNFAMVARLPQIGLVEFPAHAFSRFVAAVLRALVFAGSAVFLPATALPAVP